MSLPEIHRQNKISQFMKNNSKKTIMKSLLFLYSYKPKCYSEIAHNIIDNLQHKITNDMGIEIEKNKAKNIFLPQPSKFVAITDPKINYQFQSKSKDSFSDQAFLKAKLKKQKEISFILEESSPTKIRRNGLFLSKYENLNSSNKEILPEAKKSIKFTTKLKKNLSPINEIYEIQENQNNKGILLKSNFGMRIYDKDLFGYKTKKIVSKNILNYFIEQLSFKIKQKATRKTKSSIFLNTFIMEKFTHHLKLSSDFCDFNAIENDLTSLSKKSIVDVFNIITVPFENDKFGFKIVIADCQHSELLFFDPLKVNKMKNEENNGFKYIDYVMKFLNSEFSYKNEGRFLKKKWKIKDFKKYNFVGDFSLNGFYVAFFIFWIYKFGNITPNFTENHLLDFYFDLLKLITD